MGVHCEGVSGATADFVCFHCPLLASAEAKSPATIKTKKHGCALRRGVGGDRKAPDSPPQRRNPLLAIKTSLLFPTSNTVAPIWRDTAQLVE